MRRFTREAPSHRRREPFRHLVRDNHLAAYSLENNGAISVESPWPPTLRINCLLDFVRAPLFRNLEVGVFSGWLKGFGRFPAALSSRPPRTRLSPCSDDVRAGALSVALWRLFF